MVVPRPPTGGGSPVSPVTVYTSLRGLAGAAAAPLILLALGVLAIAQAGTVRLIPAALLVLGVVLAGIVMLDYPRHSRFDADGVTRVCLLRRHHLPWSAVVAIERTRPSSVARLRTLGRRDEPAHASGGLVARGRGRGRWLLTDRVESAEEHDRLHGLLGHLDVATTMRATRPAQGTPPTGLYRRRGHDGPTGAA